MPEDRKSPLQSLDIVSFVVLFLALVLFFYMAFYRTAQQNMRHFSSLTKKVEQDLNTLAAAHQERVQAKKETLGKGSRQDASVEKGPVSDVPVFLETINKETLASGMELSHVEKVNDTTYNLTALAPFSRLVHFLFQVEESNLAIQDLDIHPLSPHQNRIRMTLKVLEKKMSQDNLRLLEEHEKGTLQVSSDPFQRDRGAIEPTQLPDVIDLTWKFKLTGIGFGKLKTANIDRKHYREGDLFNNMRIVKIRQDRVELESESQKFFIAFRLKQAAGK